MRRVHEKFKLDSKGALLCRFWDNDEDESDTTIVLSFIDISVVVDDDDDVDDGLLSQQ